MSNSWSWRVGSPGDNAGPGLLYEPGNWGDVLKGEWALRVLEALPARERGLVLLDPFAGAPEWPLLPGAAARLADCPGCRFPAAQAGYVARGAFASTTRLLLDAARAAGQPATARVTDADADRRRRWSAATDASLLDETDGAAALARAHRDVDLLLLDPYDLFERGAPLVARALRAAPDAALLVYLFNKAPRGAERHRRYRELRDGLDRALHADRSGRALLVGRLPSDEVLPRAWHEVWLLAAQPLVHALSPALREVTTALARRFTDAGCFEPWPEAQPPR